MWVVTVISQLDFLSDSEGDLWSTSACRRNLQKSCMYGEKKQIRDSSRSVLVGRENFGNNICYFDGNCIKSSDANINAGAERRFHVQTNVSQTTTNLLYMTDDQIKQSQQITTSKHYDWRLYTVLETNQIKSVRGATTISGAVRGTIIICNLRQAAFTANE